MTTRKVDWKALDGLVPDDLDIYWQLSLRFLKIARENWPQILAAEGAVESATRRDRLIEAETQRLASSKAPVIAAGSTGSMPATAKLLATIARLPHGALVLPGLDMDLDDASWRRIAGDAQDKSHDGAPVAGHAQSPCRRSSPPSGSSAPPSRSSRRSSPASSSVSEALRPAVTTEHWQRAKTGEFAAAADAATAGVSMIEAANTEEEALAIAVALRETLETPGKTAALVTPDRALARRAAAALSRWGVAVDDSAGVSLADTGAGIFARLAAEAALGGLEPVTLLALLKHPLLRLDAAKGSHARAIATIEHTVLRGPRPRPGSEGLDGRSPPSVSTAIQCTAAIRAGPSPTIVSTAPPN